MDLRVPGQPGLQSDFQDSQIHKKAGTGAGRSELKASLSFIPNAKKTSMVRPCFKTITIKEHLILSPGSDFCGMMQPRPHHSRSQPLL